MTNVNQQAMIPFKQGLEKLKPHLNDALPSTVAKYMTPERLVKITTAGLSRNPSLLRCTPRSVLVGVMEAAGLGLDATGGSLGQAYLVPYRNRKNSTMEAQLIIGYRGLITLARRSGEIVSIDAKLIYEDDEFEIEYGLEPILKHKPNLKAERDTSKIVAGYCVAKFKDGGSHLEVMTKPEIDAIRKRSRASDNGPWNTDYEMMARKTVVRRASKYWPLSTEEKMNQAFDIENRAEEHGSVDYSDIVNLEVIDDAIGEVEEPKDSSTKLLEKVKGNVVDAKFDEAPAKNTQETPQNTEEDYTGEDFTRIPTLGLPIDGTPVSDLEMAGLRMAHKEINNKKSRARTDESIQKWELWEMKIALEIEQREETTQENKQRGNLFDKKDGHF